MEKFLTNSATSMKKNIYYEIFQKKTKILTFGELQGPQMASPGKNSTTMHLILGQTSI